MNGGPKLAVDHADRLVTIFLIALADGRDNEDIHVIEHASPESERDAMLAKVGGVLRWIKLAVHVLLYVIYI